MEPCILILSVESLISQAVDGILMGGSNRKIQDRKSGDENGRGPSEQEILKSDVDPVGIILENFLHDKIGDRPCYQVGETDEIDELFDSEKDDLFNLCPQHLSNSDLFDTATQSHGR